MNESQTRLLLSSEAIARLPSQIRTELRNALLTFDVQQIASVIRRTTVVDAALGAGSAGRAKRLARTAIPDAVQAADTGY